MKQLKPVLESHWVVVLDLVQILSSIGGRSGEPDYLEVVELAYDLLRHFEFMHAAKIRLALCVLLWKICLRMMTRSKSGAMRWRSR
jgi:hypothetical protein